MGETERLTIRNSMLAMLRDAEVEQSAAIATALSHHVTPHVDRLITAAEERGAAKVRERVEAIIPSWPTGMVTHGDFSHTAGLQCQECSPRFPHATCVRPDELRAALGGDS